MSMGGQNSQPKNRSVLISATGTLSMRRTPSKFTVANRLAQRSSTYSTRKPCASRTALAPAQLAAVVRARNR
jgi:hypothetical protein